MRASRTDLPRQEQRTTLPLLSNMKYLLGVMTLACTLPALSNQTVFVSEVKEQELQPYQKVTGSLRARTRSVIAAAESGRVLEVLVNEGAQVKKGDVIAKLDDRRLVAELGAARASYRQAKSNQKQSTAELSLAKDNYNAYKKIYDKQAVSEQVFREARSEYNVRQAQASAAQQSISSLQANIDLLKIRLDDMSIKAPFDARVIAQHIEPGEWLQPGSDAFTLIADGPLEAWVEVPERLANTLFNQETLVTVEVPATQQTLEVNASAFVPEVDNRSRNFTLIVPVENKDQRLAPGMSLNAWVPSALKSKVISVPIDAVVQGPQGTFVYKVATEDGSNKAIPIPVKVLFEAKKHTAITPLQALKEGDQVIVEGNERLMPNTPVNPVPKEKKAQ